MPANIDSMFSVREMPWHRAGNILDEYPGSWAGARTHAGLDWEPITEPVYELHGVDTAGLPVFEPVEGWNRIARSDTGKTLAVTRDTYTLINHGEMGEIVEAVLAQPNVRWETAGSLSGGAKVWCLAMLDEPVELPGDDTATYPYLAITNHHDGGGSCALRATAVRIVCANTFAAAELEGDRHGATFSFRHSKGWRDRIDEARNAVTGARREIAAYKALAAELLDIRVNAKQRELFVAEFVPMPPEGLVSDRVVANVETARQALRNILASPTTAHVADTGYGLVQAAGEYLDHIRAARSWETRLNRTLLRPEPLKHKALALVRSISNT
jgi:phage/plasmid-like protein (TIGR03299 family)